MKKKQKRLLYYCLAFVLLALAGYQGYQKTSFYKSAYDDGNDAEARQNMLHAENDCFAGWDPPFQLILGCHHAETLFFFCFLRRHLSPLSHVSNV